MDEGKHNPGRIPDSRGADQLAHHGPRHDHNEVVPDRATGYAPAGDLGDTIPYAFGIAHGEHRGLATVGHGGATYHLREEGGAGLVLHAGRLDPAPLLAVSEGVLSARRGMTLRFSAQEDGRYQAMLVDAGRVRNLRFSRVEG